MRDNSRHISLCLEMLSVVRIMFFGTVVVEEDHIQEHKKDRGVLVCFYSVALELYTRFIIPVHYAFWI